MAGYAAVIPRRARSHHRSGNTIANNHAAMIAAPTSTADAGAANQVIAWAIAMFHATQLMPKTKMASEKQIARTLSACLITTSIRANVAA